MTKLNGIKTHQVGNTIFVPLPPELHRSCNGCVCQYCSVDGKTANPDAMWDTLAVSITEGYTWTVHAPEYHGVKKKREVP
jgi:hypothetical protein